MRSGIHAAAADGSTWVLALAGSVDIEDVRELEEALQAQLIGEHRRLLVDLRRVSALHNDALIVLAKWAYRYQVQGGGIVLLGDPGTVRDFLDAQDIADLLPLCADEDAALRTFDEGLAPDDSGAQDDDDAPSPLEAAFAHEEEVALAAGACRVTQRRAVELELPTGWLVACDPLAGAREKPFEQRLPAGRWPVVLTVAELPSGESHVAFARIQLVSGARPDRWELAVTVIEDAELEGGVDTDEGAASFAIHSGIACLMDRAVAPTIASGDRTAQICRAIEERRSGEWSWAELRIPGGTVDSPDANVLAFTGGGPGAANARTYYGWGEDDELVCVVTRLLG